jgi:hypothetical protein
MCIWSRYALTHSMIALAPPAVRTRIASLKTASEMLTGVPNSRRRTGLPHRETAGGARRGQILSDAAAALREADEVAAALRKYRGEGWGVISTNEWGHEVTQTPIPLKASA